MSVLNVIIGVVFFLFPKCPFCWAAYASLFSFIGLDKLEYPAYWKYILLSVFILGSVLALRKHFKKKAWLNMVIYSVGITVLLIAYYLNYSQSIWLYIVVFFILLSNFNLQRTLLYSRLKNFVETSVLVRGAESRHKLY